MKKTLFLSLSLLVCLAATRAQQKTVLQDFTFIDGTGAGAVDRADMMITGGKITAIGNHGSFPVPADATVVNMTGKTIMPSLVLAHGHLGQIKGTVQSADNYSEENIKSQLLKYQDYGISAVLSMGTDQELIFPMREGSRSGEVKGARIYTAGYGISIANGPPPPGALTPNIQRVANPEEARKAVQLLVPLAPDVVKIWVDDFGGKLAKMPFEIYKAVIDEAHKNGLRVSAHVYYLEDARKMVNLGVDILAHSVRDKEIDDQLVQLMKRKGVYYIATLTLDEYNFAYAESPDWINDPFFRASLEPGMIDTLTSDAYKTRMKNDPELAKKKAAFDMAKRNLVKLFRVGVPIAMGTDSGAQPVRTQGFSEHLELQLMVEAGIPAKDVLQIATLNSARMLRADKDYGSLATGKDADFIVLAKNPLTDIRNTRTIESVWRSGLQVTNGMK